MSANKRYSLIIDFGNYSRIIKFKEYDKDKHVEVEKDKVNLATIDLFTTSFDNENDLKDYLDLPSDGVVKIVYASDCKLKELPVVYSNNLLLRHFSAMTGKKSDLEEKDEIFYEFLNQMLHISGLPTLRRTIVENREINLYLKTKINEYIENTRKDKFLYYKIEKELQNYKNLRSVLLCIQNFEHMLGLKLLNINIPIYESLLPKKEINVSTFIPNEDMEEPMFPPNSEEESIYNDYLDNLPNEYSCHERVIQYQLSKNKKRRN